MSARYMMIEDDPRMGLRMGDVLVCEPYWLDPTCKRTVLHREKDGFDPKCNVYNHQVLRLWEKGGPKPVRCSCCGGGDA